MPFTEYDIERLGDYRGLTPLPPDFDWFWLARMAEADDVPLVWGVTPSEIPSYDTCDYLDLWFYGIRGERLHAKYLRPRTDVPVPLVLQFHGYPGASRSWFEQSSFAGMGCALIAMDNPGQGGKSQDVGGFVGTTVSGHLIAGLDGPLEDLYYVRLYQDVRILCRVVRELEGIDLSRVYVNGASQGGGMGLACAALNPDLIGRAAILYPFLSDFRKVYELGLDEVAYDGIRYYARWFDPDGTRADEWFGKLAYVESNHFSHLVRCPVLFGTGLLDTVVPVETQCATYNELTCDKLRHLYPDHGHVEIQDFDDRIVDFFGGSAARREELSVIASDGVALRAMHVALEGKGEPRPLVLMFHDCDRPARGWHHITRFAALGYHVLQLENRVGTCVKDLGRASSDALAAHDLAVSLPGVDPSRVVAFGEGLGGSLALAVAARRQLARAVALNPFVTDELLSCAPSISCPVLLGTGRMDDQSSPELQDELAAGIARLHRKNYPKHGHERINAFEDAFLSFVNELDRRES